MGRKGERFSGKTIKNTWTKPRLGVESGEGGGDGCGGGGERLGRKGRKKENTFIISQLSIYLVVRLSYILFVKMRMFPSISLL